MSALSSTRRLAAWLASLAVLLGALAPAVAQVVVDTRGQSGWVEVCSASGMLWVQLDADAGEVDPASGEPMADGAAHCLWCKLGGGAAGLPPAPAASLGSLALPEARPQALYRSATPGAVRVAAQPRAPPLA